MLTNQSTDAETAIRGLSNVNQQLDPGAVERYTRALPAPGLGLSNVNQDVAQNTHYQVDSHLAPC